MDNRSVDYSENVNQYKSVGILSFGMMRINRGGWNVFDICLVMISVMHQTGSRERERDTVKII